MIRGWGLVVARIAPRIPGRFTRLADPLQLGSIRTAPPAAAVMAAWAAGLAKIKAPETIEGRNCTCATPISTPFSPGDPARSWAIIASYAVTNCVWVLTMG